MYPCAPLRTEANPCVPLCTPVHPCVPKRTPVYPCVPLCTPVHPCVRTPVYCTVHRVQMNTVHRGTQGAGVHGGTRGYTGVHRGTHGYCTVPLRTHAYPCVPLCTPVYLRVSLPPLCLSSRRAPARENNLRRLSSSDRSAREGGVLTAPLIVLASVRAGGVRCGFKMRAAVARAAAKRFPTAPRPVKCLKIYCRRAHNLAKYRSKTVLWKVFNIAASWQLRSSESIFLTSQSSKLHPHCRLK